MSKEKTEYLFVYGTLRANYMPSTSQASLSSALTRSIEQADLLRAKLAKHSQCLGLGHCWGRLVDAGGYPGLVLDANGKQIVGDVLELTSTALVFSYLDAYEEYGPSFAKPNEYVRRKIEVYLGIKPVPRQAWAYTYNWPTKGLAFID